MEERTKAGRKWNERWTAKRPRKGVRASRTGCSFETLEPRHFLSASPLSIQWQSLSSSNPSEAQEILDREAQWYVKAGDSAAEGLDSRPEIVPNSVPIDPFFNDQWHLLNTGQQVGNPDFQDIFGVAGQDANVLPAWELGYTGKGVIVAVVDSGTQLNHPDLAANIHPVLRLDAIDNDVDPSPDLINPINAHGTSVAGIIASPDNGVGSVGVAPDAQIAPIRLIDFGQTQQGFVQMFRFAIDQIDVFNHSWGPAAARSPSGPSGAEFQALRDSIRFGRDGLGVIHVKSSGNSAGAPFGSIGFIDQGLLDSANYDGYANSRYMIAVSGVDHDGLYQNVDGTVTSYPEAGANVLVAAPTGSNATLFITEDTGLGSGIVTADTTGDTGFNIEPLPGGVEIDSDYLPDPDYTSRFNGTSAAAPVVSGVIALMLEANPNLSYRDVQEILVRSARQNAQFEEPTTGFPLTGVNTWTANRNEIFRHADDPFLSNQFGSIPVYNPVADPNQGFQITDPFDPDSGVVRSITAFTNTPDMYTNGSGYSVSMGRGAYGELIGYGHGTIDAELAVQLAEQWTDLGESLPAELSYTTFFGGGFPIPAAEKGNQDSGFILVPGLPGGEGGFIDYYNEFFADEPFSDDDPPVDTNGSFIPLQVPDNNAMRVEWVDVKIDITGGNDLDFVRMNLVAPDGTHSELNAHYDLRPGILPASTQDEFHWPGELDPPGALSAGTLSWTFTTNRNWGARYDIQPQIDPASGNPHAGPVNFGQGWELHIENFSGSDIQVTGIEVAWHGSPIDAESKRLQGFVGIDDNADRRFNFDRYLQSHIDLDGDGEINRLGEVLREQDVNQETFAANAVVKVRKTDTGELVDQFLTGADGNFYFDLIPDFYTISVEDSLGRPALQDTLNPDGFLEKFQTEWEITPDYFSAWQHQRSDPTISGFNPATDYDILTDVNGDPLLWVNSGTGGVQEAPVTGINFLLDAGAPVVPQTTVEGFVFADLVGNGIFDGSDVLLPGVEIYADLNNDGIFDPNTEPSSKSLSDGTYALGVPTEFTQGFVIRAIPFPDWSITVPSSQFYSILGGQGKTVSDIDFGLQPSDEERLLVISGLVYSDLEGDGVQNGLDSGQSGIQVFADLDKDGQFDAGEPFAVTDTDGNYEISLPTFNFADVDVRPIVPGDGTISDPASGVINVQGGPGDTVVDVNFGIVAAAAESGTISGIIYNDRDGNGVQGASEFGAAGFRAYIDLNRNDVFDAGEPNALANSSGFFNITDVTAGSVRVRVNVPEEWVVTQPGGASYDRTLSAGGAVTGLVFGIQNVPMVDPGGGDGGGDGGIDTGGNLVDFGDLLGPPTTIAEDGPWHIVVEGFSLGSRIDGDSNGRPTADADGDDLAGVADEDGVQLVNGFGDANDTLGNPVFLQPGRNLVQVTVQGLGGLLNGWVDADGSGSFDAGEQIITDLDLLPGTYEIPFQLDAVDSSGPVAARFRWGEAGLSFTGGSLFAGEVEDYMLPTSAPNQLVITALPGDYNQDGIVDNLDRTVWRDAFGQSSDLAADGNGDGSVDLADYTIWKDNYGAVAAAAQLVSTDSDSDIGAAALVGYAPQPLWAGPQVVLSETRVSLGDDASDSGSQLGLLPDEELTPTVRRSVERLATRADADTSSAHATLLDEVFGSLPGDEPDGEATPTRVGQRLTPRSEAVVDSLFEDDLDWQPRNVG